MPSQNNIIEPVTSLNLVQQVTAIMKEQQDEIRSFKLEIRQRKEEKKELKKEISKLKDEARNHGKDGVVLQSLAKEIENLRAREESVKKALAESKDELLTKKGKRNNWKRNCQKEAWVTMLQGRIEDL